MSACTSEWDECWLLIPSAFLQALQPELRSLQTAHADLQTLGMDFYHSAPEQKVLQMKDELETLHRRLRVQQEALPER